MGPTMSEHADKAEPAEFSPNRVERKLEGFLSASRWLLARSMSCW